MADKIRPLKPAVQKTIYFYMNEIKKIDPDIITITEEWCMHFENKNHVPLFYFTFTEPLSFRIKEHSEDNTYDFITEDSPRNKRVILDHIRTLIFESYMNREGLVAKMSSNMRSYLLRAMDKNDINKYSDENLSFTAYLKDIEIFKITADKDANFLITIPQNVYRLNPEEIPMTYEFVAANYPQITEHLNASSSFYGKYDYQSVLYEVNKIRKFLNVTYGAGNVSELNNNTSVILSANYKKIVEIGEKPNGKIYLTYYLNKDFIEQDYNKANLIKLYSLMDDELYHEGKKMIDSFSDEQIVVLTAFTAAMLEYNKDITTEYPDRKIVFKVPYNPDNPFVIISRNENLDLSAFINGRTIDFGLENEAEMIDLANGYLVATDPRITVTRREIERLRSLEEYNDEALEAAKNLIADFATFPDLLRERNEYIKIELGDLVTTIENALEERARMDASMFITSEAYHKISDKLEELIASIQSLEIRVKYLEEKNEAYEKEREELLKGGRRR